MVGSNVLRLGSNTFPAGNVLLWDEERQEGMLVARNIPQRLAFDVSEYEQRHVALRRAMFERQIDVIIVTSPANLCWLTGYVASWYAPRLPVGVIVHSSSEVLTMVDWSRHADHVPLMAMYDDLVLVDYGVAPGQLADALRDRGWAVGTAAIEWSAPNPVAGVVRELAERLAGLGAAVVSGDYLIDDLRLYKSDAELVKIREAGRILDDAFDALRAELHPGLTELAIAARITALLAERGSEVAAQHALVSSGPTAWADVHGFPSRRAIEHGDIVSVDASAVIDRYHVNLSRAFAIGAWNPAADQLLQAGWESMREFCRTAVVGESPSAPMAAADASLRARVPEENIWWVGGYSLGLAFPPSWGGHAYLAGDGPHDGLLLPGYVSNFETVLFDRNEGFESAAIDTIVVSDDGVAPLSRIDRGLLLVS